MDPKRLDWTNVIFLGVSHAMAVLAVVYLAAIHFSWWTLGLGLLWFALCGVSITGGYHRLFSHRTYEANALLRAFYLLFGAASVQNSALRWSADHRRHHGQTDRALDPYSIKEGFWWAHIGWVLFQGPELAPNAVKDLRRDRLVVLQDRYYVPLAVVSGVLLPAGLGLLWGDPIGAVLVAGFLRLVVQWHATFSVNSFAHLIGSRPYSKLSSARDSFVTALLTLGEGYHNFHHRFQADYRNGIRWYHLDPTKWWVWTLSKVGVTRNLRRTPREKILRAKRVTQVASRGYRRSA